MDDLFAPPTEQWRRISPSFTTMRRLTSIVAVIVVFLVPAILVAAITGKWWLAALILFAGIVVLAVRIPIVTRQGNAWGFALRDDDLYITHGVMFRSLTAVPYGRMQLVEVNAGPIERAFGVSTVKLITASASTDATIVGLPPAEAAELRDRLTTLGETKASGL
jgi:membrane protein YdbS with pleckstrin-like domain